MTPRVIALLAAAKLEHEGHQLHPADLTNRVILLPVLSSAYI